MKKLVIILSLIFHFNSNAAYTEEDHYEDAHYFEDTYHEGFQEEGFQEYDQEAFLAGCVKATAYIAIAIGYAYLVHKFAFGESNTDLTEQCVEEGA